MNALRARLSYANVMATIAVFVALGGSSYAALQIPRASIGAKHLKANSVTGKKIKKNAVASADIKNGSLRVKDFSSREPLIGPKGDAGEPGSARAFAYLREESCNIAPCELERSKGFVGARRASVGVYCFTPVPGIDPNSSVALATVDYSGTNNPEGQASAVVQASNGSCNAGELAVITQRFEVTGAPADAAEADNVSFVVAIL